MTKPDDAVTCFKKGFSCSQAIVSTFSEEWGMDQETALRISCGFGAGIARSGNICGAVTGAILIIGLKYGKVSTGDDAAKEWTYNRVQEFITNFKAKNGSINCTELLGYDLSDPKQFKRAHECGVVMTKCPELTRDAAAILEKIL
jgi:C_GCAxxG_C_C family probable redox protein